MIHFCTENIVKINGIYIFKISSEIIGYMLMGGLILISIIRVILFCIIDKKGC